MSPKFARFIIKNIFGWTALGGESKDRACVILAAPHTSIWDFAVGYLYYRACGGHLRTMIKKEAFFFPLGCLLKSMGAFPIDRQNPQATMVQLIHDIEEAKAGKGRPFHLVICPEGTRKAVHKWKTGYHTIARQAGVPVYLSFFDYGTKTVQLLDTPVELTDNAREDTNKIQQIYEDMHITPLHPKGYVTK